MKETLGLLAGLILSVALLVVDHDPWEVEVDWPPPDATEVAPAPVGNPVVASIEQAAQRQKVPPRLLVGMAQVESNFDPMAISHAGALGILQVVPESAGREVYRLRGRAGSPSPESLFQVDYNADIAAEYVAWLRDYFGPEVPVDVIVAAYNAGPTRVRRCLQHGERWRSCLPPETRNYLVRVEQAAGGISWQT